ncbi:hypothetical protein QFZ67_007470 [Streptomyces sp. V1I1]|nr:hypothetical protein [Streptomyces sp. V1I1]
MDRLLSVIGEPGYGRWLSLDEHRPGAMQALRQSPADSAVLDAIGPDMDMCDGEGIYMLLCRQCPALRTPL